MIVPTFHLSPCVGWMNDPNGFSFYQGEYHLFYQSNPYDTVWDTMHWPSPGCPLLRAPATQWKLPSSSCQIFGSRRGHAVSRDLLRWNYLPAALAPDEAYDAEGCFSGSALPLADGRQLLMYTGVRREEERVICPNHFFPSVPFWSQVSQFCIHAIMILRPSGASIVWGA